jgi:hypothetical protein
MSVARSIVSLFATPAGLVFASTLAIAAPPNAGGLDVPIEAANVISFAGPKVDGGPPNVLYAPSDADNPGYRAAIAGFTGGVVDYFNANAATPALAFLLNYDVVYTWTNGTYFDRVAMGNVLADYVDAGGKVLLAGFCTYTSGNSLGGRIMNNDYCPVRSPAGTNHYASSNYSGNGTSWQHRNVLFYQDQFRDFLQIQGLGVLDGTYNDGEIATAHRPDGRVMYMNGVGPPVGAAGDWARIVANFALWRFLGGSLFASGEDGKYYAIHLRTGKAIALGTTLPLGPTGDIDFDETTGASLSSAGPYGGRIHAFAVGTGAPVGGAIASAAGTYAALEHIPTGGWWGTSHAFDCGPSTLTQFNPATGAITSGPHATGVNSIKGISFNIPLNRMYYATDAGCPGGGLLYYNSAPGAPLNGLGTIGFSPGDIEFGPDDNLYGVNVGANSKLYRINPTTGVTTQIGTLTGVAGLSGLMRVNGSFTVDAGSIDGPPLTGLALASPLPNPSARATDVVLRFSLPSAGSARVALYDMAGRRVWSFEQSNLSAGAHALVWDGRDLHGTIARAGVYVVKLESAAGSRTTKLLRL